MINWGRVSEDSLEINKRKIFLNVWPFVFAAVVMRLDRVWMVSESGCEFANSMLFCGLVVICFRWFLSQSSSNFPENSWPGLAASIVVNNYEGGLWGRIERREVPPAIFWVLGVVLFFLAIFPLIDQVVTTLFHIAPPYSHVSPSN